MNLAGLFIFHVFVRFFVNNSIHKIAEDIHRKIYWSKNHNYSNGYGISCELIISMIIYR